MEVSFGAVGGWLYSMGHIAGLIQGWHLANERQRYFVTASLIGCVQI